jgi:hypothetical protein
VLQEGSSNECGVGLPTCCQIDTRERAIDGKIQTGHEYLGEVHIDDVMSAYPGHDSLVDDWEMQPHRHA